MGITRTVTTQVHCDVCGKWVIGWESEETGISREWAKYYARLKGCTAGQKVICKECRITVSYTHLTLPTILLV